MSVPCRVRARSSGAVAILDLAGDLTHQSEGPLLAALHAPAAVSHRCILLNFGHVGYINSAGISLLINLIMDQRNAGHHLMACELSPHYQKIFRMVGLSGYLDVHPNETDALNAAQSR